MRREAGFGPVAVLALTASSACVYSDSLELHPDMVSLEILLVTGESEARMLAIHPHQADAVPDVSARLVGPGGRLRFPKRWS